MEPRDRRGFLGAAVALLGGAIAGGVGLLGGAYVRATSRWPVRSAKKWAALCTLADLKGDEPFSTSFRFKRLEGWYVETVTRQVYVAKDGDGRPVVFSRRCTHLGCPVTWRPLSGGGGGQYVCPCHGGKFDASGRVTDGPPPRGLDRLESRIAGEMVEVAEA